VYGERPQRQGRNVAVTGTLSLNGLLTQRSNLGAVDGLILEALIAQKLAPHLWKGTVVIIDNCSVYRGEVIEALMTAAGAHLIDLPPYSPDFSPYAFGGAKPYENCWSKIKTILRHMGARTYSDLLKALDEATKQDLLN
jgi:DDE superfamily endonuclease